MAVRLPKRAAPKDKVLLEQVLGEVKNGLMSDCVYNSIVMGEYEGFTWPDDSSVWNFPDYLKSYQVEDLTKSLCMDNVFNINKPGYGKTLETIMWIKLKLQKDFNALILCPKSVISTWHNQLKKFWPDYLKDGMWWITNYEQLYDEDRFALAKEFEWDVVVLDESHKIKSCGSDIYAIVTKLNCKHRHCLTGTPMKKGPEDLAAQLKFLDPYSITNFTDFQTAFCEMQKDRWGWKPNGLTKRQVMRDNLQKLLYQYCVGGEEHNVIEPPQLIKVRLEVDSHVKALYQKIVGEYDPDLKKKVIDTVGLLEMGVKVSNSIEAATRRQQVASNPQLFDPTYVNVKFEWIADWLDGCDEKVIIFSKYAKTIEALEQFLKKKKVRINVVKREQNAALRQAQIDNWNKRGQVLLGSYGVLSEGVDGLQENCRYAIFVDREWTRADNEQAEKRIARTGQTRQVIFYVLQAIGTIDMRIERVQYKRGEDAAALLEPPEEDE